MKVELRHAAHRRLVVLLLRLFVGRSVRAAQAARWPASLLRQGWGLLYIRFFETACLIRLGQRALITFLFFGLVWRFKVLLFAGFARSVAAEDVDQLLARLHQLHSAVDKGALVDLLLDAFVEIGR